MTKVNPEDLELTPGGWIMSGPLTTPLSVTEAIQENADSWFTGPSRAFFSVFGNRVVYKSYRYRAGTEEEALKAIEHCVIAEIDDLKRERNLPMWPRDLGVVVIWRSPVSVERSDNGYVAFARLAIVPEE